MAPCSHVSPDREAVPWLSKLNQRNLFIFRGVGQGLPAEHTTAAARVRPAQLIDQVHILSVTRKHHKQVAVLLSHKFLASDAHSRFVIAI
jgi:hypothetical protein